MITRPAAVNAGEIARRGAPWRRNAHRDMTVVTELGKRAGIEARVQFLEMLRVRRKIVAIALDDDGNHCCHFLAAVGTAAKKWQRLKKPDIPRLIQLSKC